MISDKSICFLHVPKTGGTSLIRALRTHYSRRSYFTKNGNITVDYIHKIYNRLDGMSLIAGHAGPGVVDALRGRVRFVTVLRKPAEQAVSHYLHVRRDRSHPLYDDAVNLSFTDWLKKCHYQIIFQTASLFTALAPEGADIFRSIDKNFEMVHAFLNSECCVGVLDRTTMISDVLANILPEQRRIDIPHLRTAKSYGVPQTTISNLLDEYDVLRRDANLRHLFDLEEHTYRHACSLLERSVHGLDRQRPEPAGPMPAAVSPVHVLSGMKQFILRLAQ